MKLLWFILLTFWSVFVVDGAEIKLKEELKAMSEQLEMLKTQHSADIAYLKREVQELKKRSGTPGTLVNEQSTLQTAVKEIKKELRELNHSIYSPVFLKQLFTLRNELKEALLDTEDIGQFSRTQEERVDNLEKEMTLVKAEQQHTRDMAAKTKVHLSRFEKEMKIRAIEELAVANYNDVLDVTVEQEGSGPNARAIIRAPHKLRHSNKMAHSHGETVKKMTKLAQVQEQLEERMQSLETQVKDVQNRVDHFQEPNWNLLSAKVDFLDLETKIIRQELKNDSQKIGDFNKIHASILELREDVEGIENKIDKTIPEFRKEISKLDINSAQMTAASSYLKEDQEKLHQSVKAIAVSVSNAIDRAEMDRLAIHRINESIFHLDSRSKQHFHRLNDHILKSEANQESNLSHTIPLPQLMQEVKELQPVEHEYDDLVNQLPRDCSVVDGPAGVYLIHPGITPIDTWCDKGSTLLQRRYNGSIEFNRKFNDYVRGFGNPESEYWLGLQAINQITADNCSSMRIDMTDIYGAAWYAQYEHFSVGNADTGYRLEVSGFKGNASDAFGYQNHMEFSTIDRDRDISNTNCASNYEGGWWYSHCQHVNINGKYNLGLTWFDSARNEWIAVATSEMRIYRISGCH